MGWGLHSRLPGPSRARKQAGHREPLRRIKGSRVEDWLPRRNRRGRFRDKGETPGLPDLRRERGRGPAKGMDPGPCSRRWGPVEACGRIQRILCPRAN
ncbi:protein of unknown function [Kyrpidia spormannii]|uniref:Uncharacterized protein n=1 Tax=Kyrpidia spormannii TaxID=2055160 RepID=A0ACA8ZBY9_9BACL|nr:protein of unknown function [Kyrpidia spormannii]